MEMATTRTTEGDEDSSGGEEEYDKTPPVLMWVKVSKRRLSVLDGLRWVSRDFLFWPCFCFAEYKNFVDYCRRNDWTPGELETREELMRSCARTTKEITRGTEFHIAGLIGRPSGEYVEVQRNGRGYQQGVVYPYNELPRNLRPDLKKDFNATVPEMGSRDGILILDDQLLFSYKDALDTIGVFTSKDGNESAVELSRREKKFINVYKGPLGNQPLSDVPKWVMRKWLAQNFVLTETRTYSSRADAFKAYKKRVRESHHYCRRHFEYRCLLISKFYGKEIVDRKKTPRHGNALTTETKENIIKFLEDLKNEGKRYSSLNKLAIAYKSLKGDCGRTSFLNYATLKVPSLVLDVADWH